MTNAVKFTEEGVISISIQKESNDSLKFIVADTGIGIDSAKLDVIFERFRQADELSTFKGGTGLGLAIIKALVDKLTGEIKVKSKKGEGSSFIVTLPFKQENIRRDDTRNTIRKGDKTCKSNLKILVAEDENVNFMYINELLKSEGYKVFHAKDGKESVKLFNKVIPDLVLMDIKMPVMNGYTAFEKIKKLNQNIPVIALTAYAQSDDRERIYKAGFDYYLPKPVSEEALINAINRFTNI